MQPAHTDIDLERAALGTLIISPARIHEARVTLAADDFYDAVHAQIYRAIEAIADDGLDGDIAIDLLVRRVADMGGTAGVSDVDMLIEHSRPPRLLGHCIIELKRLAKRRHLVKIAGGIHASVSAREMVDAEQIASDAAGELSEISEAEDIEPAVSGDDAVQDAISDVLMRADGHGPRLIKTGFADIDEKLVGLFPGNLILIGARPGVGKTAIALNIAANVADEGGRVLFLSLEMSSRELALRQLAGVANIPMHVLRAERPDLTPNQRDQLAEAGRSHPISRVQLQCPSGLTPDGLRGRIARAAQDGGLDLVVVDYVQLMRTKQRETETTEWMELTEISRSIKEQAREFGIPILALAQLNREPARRSGASAPQLTDLRGSGSLEQDADVVMMLHREDDQSYEYELFIRKHRNGPLGKVDLIFSGRTTRFLPPSAADWDEEEDDL